MPHPLRLTPVQARRAALRAALLYAPPRLPAGVEGAARVIEHLGYVQLDTIAVVERAHHHTLWTRLPGYSPPLLDGLYAARRVFEYWGHAASVLPLTDYRYYLPVMRRFREHPSAWTAGLNEHAGEVKARVLRRVREAGPLRSADFEAHPGERGGWWDWKPAKAALELLLWEGALMVCARQGFQRVYDLTERVLPQGFDLGEPAPAELGAFALRRALQAQGVARAKDIAAHLPVVPRDAALGALQAALSGGTVRELALDGQDQPYYALAEHLPALLSRGSPRPRLHILSPFDNAAILRDRLRRLFGFDYTVECYTPAPKRRFGYFSLPVVWNDACAGRLDAKAERKQGALDVRGLWLEKDFKPGAEFLDALAARLREFAAFNACAEVRISGAQSAALARELKRRVLS